jgi:hypothetical protein
MTSDFVTVATAPLPCRGNLTGASHVATVNRFWIDRGFAPFQKNAARKALTVAAGSLAIPGWRKSRASDICVALERFSGALVFSTTWPGSFLGSFRFVFGSFFRSPNVFNNFSASFLGSFRFVFGSFLIPTPYFQQLLRFVFEKTCFFRPISPEFDCQNACSFPLS